VVFAKSRSYSAANSCDDSAAGLESARLRP
jgi:hypothetical protein